MKRELVVLLFLSGCGGSFAKKKQLASTHFRQASLDVKDYQETRNVSSLRKALNEIDLAVAAQPNAQIFSLKATILLQLGELAQSKAVFERVVNDKKISHARRADARNNYATVLCQLGDVTRAQAIWFDLIGDSRYISPEVAYFNLGYSELNEARKAGYKAGDQSTPAAVEHVRQAAGHFKNALSISREYVDALFFLGQSHIMLGELGAARDCMMSALTINPSHALAQTVLNQIEAQLAKLPEQEPKAPIG